MRKRHWALVGFWHGCPCAIQRGHYVPPFSCWYNIGRDEWRSLRRDGFYTRRSSKRPIAFVDAKKQKVAPVRCPK